MHLNSLTAIAPALLDEGLHLLEGMLVARQTQYMTSTAAKSLAVYEMFQIYDHRLGARQNPDPNSFAILLLLSKSTPSYEMKDVDNFSLKLNNPWLRLAARVVARLDTPDEPGLDIRSFHGNRDHNIMAALSLPRYTEGEVTQFTESVFLASFLESREFVISSLALEYYIRTAISYVDLPAPSCYLSGAICAIFNVVLHDHRLRMGWTILEIFVDGFENLSGEWRQTFAEAFFSLSRQPLPRSQGSMVTTTPDLELEEILTWEYFHKEEQEYQFTDLDFSGLDWMAIAWSLHLSQRSETTLEDSTEAPREAESQDSDRPTLNEEFVLQALCKLLDAAPYYQIIPITPKLHEFIQWFDDAELSGYRGMISAHIEEAVRRDAEVEMIHRFGKFHCMWYDYVWPWYPLVRLVL